VFQIYVTSVLSGCCKNRLGVAPVAMRVKSEGGASSPCAWSCGSGPYGRTKCRLGRGSAGPSTGNKSTEQTSRRGCPFERPDASTVTLEKVVNKSL
jgi:hypothetical protein